MSLGKIESLFFFDVLSGYRHLEYATFVTHSAYVYFWCCYVGSQTTPAVFMLVFTDNIHFTPTLVRFAVTV